MRKGGGGVGSGRRKGKTLGVCLCVPGHEYSIRANLNATHRKALEKVTHEQSR